MTKTIYTLIIAASLVTLLPASQSLADLSVTVTNTPLPVTITNSTGAPSSVTVINPAKTSSVDDPGRIPYQFGGALGCVGSLSCRAATPAVPQGTRLVVQHVSAFGEIGSPGTNIEVLVSLNNQVPVISAFDSPISNTKVFAFDQPVPPLVVGSMV
jgi:hypothetical protein